MLSKGVRPSVPVWLHCWKYNMLLLMPCIIYCKLSCFKSTAREMQQYTCSLLTDFANIPHFKQSRRIQTQRHWTQCRCIHSVNKTDLHADLCLLNTLTTAQQGTKYPVLKSGLQEPNTGSVFTTHIKIHSNIILVSTPTSTRYFLPFTFRLKFYFHLAFPSCYMPQFILLD
jgi:hypothetical protein